MLSRNQGHNFSPAHLALLIKLLLGGTEKHKNCQKNKTSASKTQPAFTFFLQVSSIPQPILYKFISVLRQMWFYFLCRCGEVLPSGTGSAPSPPFLISSQLLSIPTEPSIFSTSNSILVWWWPWEDWLAASSPDLTKHLQIAPCSLLAGKKGEAQ